jgi:hypothetical protein
MTVRDTTKRFYIEYPNGNVYEIPLEKIISCEYVGYTDDTGKLTLVFQASPAELVIGFAKKRKKKKRG